MTKITLDRETFKALASDTRLEILRVLDGKNLSLNDIMKSTSLNKATLHEHLTKLNGAGLVKRQEREGHKWVYYRLTWKGEGLLHPENTRIVVLFTTTFVLMWAGIIQLISYVKGSLTSIRYDLYPVGKDMLMADAHEFNIMLSKPPGGNVSNLPSLLPDNIQRVLAFVKEGNTNAIHSPSSIPLDGDLLAIQTNGGSGIYAYDSLGEGSRFVVDKSQGVLQAVYQDPMLLYIAIGCFLVFTVVLCIGLWRLWENKTPKL